MIDGLREYAAKHHTQITPAVSVGEPAAEIAAAPASPRSPRIRTPISTRPTEDVEVVAPVEKKITTPRAQIEQKSVTPKVRAETPKAKADSPKIQVNAIPEAPADEETSEPVIAAATVLEVDVAPVSDRRRSLHAPIAASAVIAAEPVVEAPAAVEPTAPTGEQLPVFKWAPFKEDPKSSHDEASDSSRASSASDSERIAALKSKAKPALTHKVLNKLKSPIKKASRSPIRIAAPKPPVPTAVAKAAVAPRATNMPDFDKLHNKAFSRRESLNSFQKRQSTTVAKPAVPAPAPAIAAKSEPKSANVSFVGGVPSTPQQKQRRLSKPATPFVGQKDIEPASSADEKSDKSETKTVSAIARPTAVVPVRAPQTGVPKRPVVAAAPSSGAKKPKFDLQASLAKGALPYKAAVANPAPRVLKDANASLVAPAEKVKRPADADEQRKKMRASMAVQPTTGSAGRRLSTVN